jgi:hypothetical protein
LRRTLAGSVTGFPQNYISPFIPFGVSGNEKYEKCKKMHHSCRLSVTTERMFKGQHFADIEKRHA